MMCSFDGCEYDAAVRASFVDSYAREVAGVRGQVYLLEEMRLCSVHALELVAEATTDPKIVELQMEAMS